MVLSAELRQKIESWKDQAFKRCALRDMRDLLVDLPKAEELKIEYKATGDRPKLTITTTAICPVVNAPDVREHAMSGKESVAVWDLAVEELVINNLPKLKKLKALTFQGISFYPN